MMQGKSHCSETQETVPNFWEGKTYYCGKICLKLDSQCLSHKEPQVT